MKFLTFFFLVLLMTSLRMPVKSAGLTQASLRLDEMSPSSPIKALVCAKPSDASPVEGKISIVFPPDFTINQSAANWTTTTASLPNGTTPWPALGTTASAIDGQTVIVSSGNLTDTQALYCFSLISTPSRTSTTSGTKNGSIQTKSADGALIASTSYALSIAGDDHISVTGVVKPNASQVQLDLSTTHPTTDIRQDAQLNFEIVYGSYTYIPMNLTIEVEARQGTIVGSGAPSVNVLDYIYGSAEPTADGVSPVVDPVAKKIRWTLPAFPARTLNRKVYFALRTNNSYQGSSTVRLDIATRIFGPNFVTPDAVITKQYRYIPGPPASSTGSTATPTPTPTSGTGSTGNNPSALRSSQIRTIYLPTISQDDAKIFIGTYGKYFHSVRYGSDVYNLTDKVTSLNATTNTTLNITDLMPETTYYFKAEITDENGKITGTETFTFETAKVSDAPTIEKSSFFVTSQSNVIASPQSNTSGSSDPNRGPPNIIVPKASVYEIRFALKKNQTAKKVQAIVRSKTVLGLTTIYAEEPNTDTVDMVQIEPGIWSGSLTAKTDPGYYEQYVRIEDYNGNVAEEKVAEIKILPPFTVRSASDNNPLEGVRVILSLYNSMTKLYEPLGPNVTAVNNPSFTGPKGTVDFVLPPGKYRAVVDEIGYKEQTVNFTIGMFPEDTYPTVLLQKHPFNILYIIQYFARTITDVFLEGTKIYIQGLAESVRFFHVTSSISVAILVVLTFLSFSYRIHIPMHSLIEFFLHRRKIFSVQQSLGAKIHGRLFDEVTGQGVPNAHVYLIDAQKNKIVGSTASLGDGSFTLTKLQSYVYTIDVMKNGYEPMIFHESDIQSIGLGGYLLTIKKHDQGPSVREETLLLFQKLWGVLFETLLVGTFVFELALGFSLGWLRSAPFLAASTVNLLLWLVHLSHLRNEKNLF